MYYILVIWCKYEIKNDNDPTRKPDLLLIHILAWVKISVNLISIEHYNLFLSKLWTK